MNLFVRGTDESIYYFFIGVIVGLSVCLINNIAKRWINKNDIQYKTKD